MFFKEKNDDDKFNYLDGKSVYKVNLLVFKGMLEVYLKIVLVFNIVIEIVKLDEYVFGYLF